MEEGGAGGYLSGTLSVAAGQSYTVIGIGAGGVQELQDQPRNGGKVVTLYVHI